MATAARFSWRFAIVIAVAAAATIVVRWPLAWATHWLPAGVRCDWPAGTLWHGRCGTLAVDGVLLGDTSWQLHPLALLRGTLAADLSAQQGADRIAARVELRPDGRRIARNVEADLTLGSGMLQQGAAGLSGRVHAQFERAVLHGRAVRDLAGVVTVRGLAQGQTPLGSFEVRFPAAPAGGNHPGSTNGAPGVTGALRDIGGPLGVAGTLTLTDEPGYVVDGRVTVRADTPPALARQIALLGTPDAAGGRPFSVAGTY